MAYVSYKDVPLYFSGPNAGNDPRTDAGNHTGVFCQQVQLNYTPNIAPVRLLGDSPSRDNFNLAGPPNASLSFSFYIGTGIDEFDPTDYTGDVGDLGAGFVLGDYNNGLVATGGAFLTSFSYTLTPYSPVLVQCDFAIYSPMLEGGLIAEENVQVINDVDFADYGHGAYSAFGGTNLNNISVFESIQYQFSANRLPIYQIGNRSVSQVELITAEQSIQVQGDNIQALVPITGSNPGNVTIDVKNSAGTTLFSTPINGRITAENVSVAGGDLARGSITITELLK